jgi:hypothetical protein
VREHEQDMLVRVGCTGRSLHLRYFFAGRFTISIAAATCKKISGRMLFPARERSKEIQETHFFFVFFSFPACAAAEIAPNRASYSIMGSWI